MDCHKCLGRVTCKVRVTKANCYSVFLDVLSEYKKSLFVGCLAKCSCDFNRRNQIELEIAALDSYGATVIECAEVVKNVMLQVVPEDKRSVTVTYSVEL